MRRCFWLMFTALISAASRATKLPAAAAVAALNTDNKQLNLKISEASMVSIQNDFLSAKVMLPAATPQFLSAPQLSDLGTAGAQ